MRFTKAIWHSVIVMDQKHIEIQVNTPFKLGDLDIRIKLNDKSS